MNIPHLLNVARETMPTVEASPGSSWRFCPESESWAQIPLGRTAFEPEIHCGARPFDDVEDTISDVIEWRLEQMDALEFGDDTP